MNYYYDIVLNWNEEDFYNFYEWNDNDYLELIKKIPLFKVKHKTLNDFLANKVQVSEEFLKLIKDKTILSGKNIVKKLEYAAIFTDSKSVVALEFNKDGLVINGSNLLVDDDLNILEFSYNLREYEINYKVIEERAKRNELRQEMEAKKIISLEIDSLYQNKDLAKLKYLYYEYRKEEINDIDDIYQRLKEELANNFNSDILKLYYIIKLSYHNV